MNLNQGILMMDTLLLMTWLPHFWVQHWEIRLHCFATLYLWERMWDPSAWERWLTLAISAYITRCLEDGQRGCLCRNTGSAMKSFLGCKRDSVPSHIRSEARWSAGRRSFQRLLFTYGLRLILQWYLETKANNDKGSSIVPGLIPDFLA